MTAVPTVSYYVSDCHAERYPYDAARGFAGAAVRDAHRVFDGALPNSVPYLLHRITCSSSSDDDNSNNSNGGDSKHTTTTTVTDEQRARALHLLHAHTSSPELAVQLLSSGVVCRVVHLLAHCAQEQQQQQQQSENDKADSSANAASHDDVDMRRLVVQQSLLLLRSLCRVPQGVVAVVRGGGVGAALDALANALSSSVAAMTTAAAAAGRPTNADVATAAVQLLYAVARDRAGRAWLLRCRPRDEGNAACDDEDVRYDEACAHDAIVYKLRGADDAAPQLSSSSSSCAAAAARVTEWCACRAHDVVASFADVLDVCLHASSSSASSSSPSSLLSALEQHTLDTLAELTTEVCGVRACVASVRVVDYLARRLRDLRCRVEAEQAATTAAAAAAQMSARRVGDDDATLAAHATVLFTTLWNVALDTHERSTPAHTSPTTHGSNDKDNSSSSAHMLDARGVTEELFALLLCTLHAYGVADDKDGSDATRSCATRRRAAAAAGVFAASVQRHALGALAALHALTRVKLSSTDALGRYASRTHALLALLQCVNAQLDTASSSSSSSSPLVAMCKNTVHCLRLSSEVAAVRACTHAWLDKVAADDAVAAFYLRRQLYYGTAWQAEYDADV